jgi:hypothetical protein
MLPNLTEFKELYDRLKSQALLPEEFFETPSGADLWIDGVDCLRSVQTEDAVHAYRLLRVAAQRSRHVDAPKGELGAFLNVVSSIARVIAGGDSEGKIWAILAASLTVLQHVRGRLDIFLGDCSIVNDSLMLSLSPTYRNTRFLAYNEGVEVGIAQEQNDSLFRPEYKSVLMGPPIAIIGAQPKVQFYNLAHEAGHIVYYGDIYARFFGSFALSHNLFLVAEEALIGADLLMMRDVSNLQIGLHAAKEFRGIEPGQQGGVVTSFATRASMTSKGIRHSQLGLRATAIRESNVIADASLSLVGGWPKPAGLDEWMDASARKKHYDGAVEIANRVGNAGFQRIVGMLPRNIVNEECLWNSYYQYSRTGETFHGIVAPDPNDRQRRIALNKKRSTQLILRAADTVYAAALDGVSNYDTFESAVSRWVGRLVGYRLRGIAGMKIIQEFDESWRQLIKESRLDREGSHVRRSLALAAELMVLRSA